MNKVTINPSSFEFLKILKKNNNRDWFALNKNKYISELEQITSFADALLIEMNKIDVIETPSGKKSLHRIYKDTRFSKEKIPYKTNWSGSFTRATKQRRGGYYFHLEPGNTFIAGGFWEPEPKDLKRIRDEFAYDAEPLRKILKSKTFKDTFASLIGDQIKTSPKGYDSKHPNIDLLRYKQFILMKKFTDKEAMADSFVKEVASTFYKMKPFLNYMTEILTTDVNGISID